MQVEWQALVGRHERGAVGSASLPADRSPSRVAWPARGRRSGGKAPEGDAGGPLTAWRIVIVSCDGRRERRAPVAVHYSTSYLRRGPCGRGRQGAAGAPAS